jgi:hypothetical protein
MKVPCFYGTPAFIIVPQDTDTGPHTRPVKSKPQLLFLYNTISFIPHLRLRGILTGLFRSDFALKIALLHPTGVEHRNNIKKCKHIMKLLLHLKVMFYTQFMCNPGVQQPVCETAHSGRLAPSLRMNGDISGFRRQADTNSVLLGFYAASNGNPLNMIRQVVTKRR